MQDNKADSSDDSILDNSRACSSVIHVALAACVLELSMLLQRVRMNTCWLVTSHERGNPAPMDPVVNGVNGDGYVNAASGWSYCWW